MFTNTYYTTCLLHTSSKWTPKHPDPMTKCPLTFRFRSLVHCGNTVATLEPIKLKQQCCALSLSHRDEVFSSLYRKFEYLLGFICFPEESWLSTYLLPRSTWNSNSLSGYVLPCVMLDNKGTRWTLFTVILTTNSTHYVCGQMFK